MGNTDSANLDAARIKSEQRITSDALRAIEQNDVTRLKQMLQYDCDSYCLNASLNKEGDTALIYSVRCKSGAVLKLLLDSKCDIQARNKTGDTALGIAVNNFTTNPTKSSHLDIVISSLLGSGAIGPGLSKLILHYMTNAGLILEIIHCLPDFTSEQYYKYSGLLLQSSLWFDHRENVKYLLQKGIYLQAYWDVPFMPQITPNSSFNYQDNKEEECAGDYSVAPPHADELVQQTKLSLVHDWRHDWNEGENPEAIFRAGLQLPLNYLNIFIRTATAQETYISLIQEIFKYPPVESGGPAVHASTFKLLVNEGYIFTEAEQRTLTQKYQIPGSIFVAPIQCQTLKQCCRNFIRGCGRTNVLHLVQQLAIPLPIKLYILLGDMDENGEASWLLTID